jgi:hypothetical protein
MRNQAGHSKSLKQETTVQLQQAHLQAALAHRERVQQVEGLQAHRNPVLSENPIRLGSRIIE